MLDYLTIKEMASRTGLSEERIRQLIRTHQIRGAIKLGGWRVRVADFEEFLRSRVFGDNGFDGNGQRPPQDGSGKTGNSKG